MSIAKLGLGGLRVLSLESRRQAEMARLIESHGGTAVSAPALREVPLEENPEALAFARDLLQGQFDAVIFLTGVGTRILFGAMETRYARAELVAALSRILVVARGPKPVAALRELGVPVGIAVPEPNTWRDIVRVLDEQRPPFDLEGKRLAIQEYGVSNPEFLDALRRRGARITTVKAYQWALPENLEPLRQAVREIAAGRIDLLLVTSAAQVSHLMQVAAEQGLEERMRAGLRRTVIASIGPIASEALQSFGVAVDLQPSHPKMGQLVFEAAQAAAHLLEKKRNAAATAG
ncbi:MAG TPA: uroporphyrinogen-III synthase [Terriglobia bacterium]|nr:uroporphyrinogen-III synthase [Terriglobia bacterium]